MQTVASIVTTVYGDARTAAEKLAVGRSAVSNWKTWGHFPAHVAIQIAEHARQKRIKLDATDIPIMRDRKKLQRRKSETAQ